MKSTTVYVPSSELGLSHPLSRQRVCPSPRSQRGGAHSPAGEGLGESQFRRLEKSLALCLLCADHCLFLGAPDPTVYPWMPMTLLYTLGWPWPPRLPLGAPDPPVHPWVRPPPSRVEFTIFLTRPTHYPNHDFLSILGIGDGGEGGEGGSDQAAITSSTCCQIPPGLLGQFSQKIRPLEKKLGRKPATPPPLNHQKKCSKKILLQFFGQFLPIIVKIRPQLGNLELGRFLGRWLPRPQEIVLSHFWVQRPWIRPSGIWRTYSLPPSSIPILFITIQLFVYVPFAFSSSYSMYISVSFIF
jgi:hypothetical protein